MNDFFWLSDNQGRHFKQCFSDSIILRQYFHQQVWNGVIWVVKRWFLSYIRKFWKIGPQIWILREQEFSTWRLNLRNQLSDCNFEKIKHCCFNFLLSIIFCFETYVMESYLQIWQRFNLVNLDQLKISMVKNVHITA